jgi:Cu+-exporting ATPase
MNMVPQVEGKLEILCSLCGLGCGSKPIESKDSGDTLMFCCTGCLNVHALLRARGILKPGVDPRETDLFKRSAALGLISTREEAASSPATASNPYLREKRLRVSGMWSEACARMIEAMLRKERAVVSAEVSYVFDLLTAQYDARYAPSDYVAERVTSLGYHATEYDATSSTSPAERKDLLVRAAAAVVLWVIVMLLNLALYAERDHEPAGVVRYLPFVVMVLAVPAVLYAAKPIFALAWRGVLNHVVRAESLLSASILIALGFAAVQAFRGSTHIYFDLACAITVLTLIARWIERSAKERIARAIERPSESLPRQVRKLDLDGVEQLVNVELLKTDDRFVVKPGERIPVDGVVIEGEARVNESLLTGDSTPVNKKAGDKVIGGSINEGEELRLSAAEVGAKQTLAKILRIVENAVSKRLELERNADKVVRFAVPAVIALAALIVAITGDALRAVTMLVIGCPCALGTTTPLALAAAIGYASRRGIVMNDVRSLETISGLNAMVLDKTGTITPGRYELVEAPQEDLPMIAAVEQYSGHPLGIAVVAKLAESGRKPMRASGIEIYRGVGISGLVGVGRLYIGRRDLFEGADKEQDVESEGRSVFYYGWDRIVTGRVVCGDRFRFEARSLVEFLHESGIETMVVSNDTIAATGWACREVYAREFRAAVLPGGKAEVVEGLQQAGKRVAMVGDGISDAQALAKANLGIALGGGADLASRPGAVVVLKNDPRRVVEMLALSRRALRLIQQNTYWSYGYNAVGMLLAAFGLLDPLTGSFAMLIWSVCLTGNSLRLSRKPRAPRYP